MRFTLVPFVLGVTAAVFIITGSQAAEPPTTGPASRPAPLRRVNQEELAQTLEKATAGKWQTDKNWVVSAVRKEKTPQPLILITHASCQQDQTLALDRMASWQRPMAIVWSGNGWTLVSDMNGWFLYPDELTKVVNILRVTRPSWDDYRAFARTAESQPAP